MRAEPQAPLWAESGIFSDEKQAVCSKKHVKIQEKMAVGRRTVPCPKTFLRNNPVWILDVPAEKIDESYVLHFGDYDLKGTEILPSLKSGD